MDLIQLTVGPNEPTPLPSNHPTTRTHTQAPTDLLRLPLHLHALQHPPPSLHTLGFWPQWLAAAAAVPSAWARLPPHDLAALPPALASLEATTTTTDTAALVAVPWLEAALVGQGLSLQQWAEGLEGLSALLLSFSSSSSCTEATTITTALLSLSPFRPRVIAAVREALVGGVDSGVGAVPQLWGVLASLGWLGGEEEESVVSLLARVARRGVGRWVFMNVW